MNNNLTPWQKYKQNLGETRPWDLLNPNSERAFEEEANRRYSICQACPELIQLTKTCKKCGCFMAAKTKLEKASCPIGKW
jgi:hypothetical protein